MPEPCLPPLALPPLESLPAEMRALILYMQAIAQGISHPVSQAINRAICEAPPVYVQQPPYVTPPFRAQPADIFARAFVTPTGNAAALAGAVAMQAAEVAFGGTAAPILNVASGNLVELGFFLVPEQERVVYQKIEFRGHDWAAQSPLSRFQIKVGDKVIVDMQEFPETPKPTFVQAASRQRVSVMVANLDIFAASLFEVRVSGYRYPVEGRDDSVSGTLLRTGMTEGCHPK